VYVVMVGKVSTIRHVSEAFGAYDRCAVTLGELLRKQMYDEQTRWYRGTEVGLRSFEKYSIVKVYSSALLDHILATWPEFSCVQELPARPIGCEMIPASAIGFGEIIHA
jgi:hypothetical protein